MSDTAESSVVPPPDVHDGDDASAWPLWAIYLGVSWTWCIGMFLPVLLIRDYGNAAFWAFAIPNVVGAAAMGWVMRSPAQSAAFVATHQLAVRAFSIVTILFHAFFIGWIGYIKADALWPAVLCVIALAAMLTVARRSARQGGILVAVFALLTSLGIGAALVQTIWRIDLSAIVQRRTDAALIDLAGLSAVCLMGFLFCPYLDATFHHARQNLSTRRGSKLAFAIGFGMVFAAMIALTFAYADVINLSATTRGAIGSYIAIHIAIQAAATMALHASTEQPRWSPGALALIAVAGTGLAAGGWAADAKQGELIYRLFMAFYGLAAPAYVWIVGIKQPYAPTRRQWIILLIAILAAAPFYWLAFIEMKMVWVLVGVGIVLLTKLLSRESNQDRRAAGDTLTGA